MTPKQAKDGVVSRMTQAAGDRGFRYSKKRGRFERQAGEFGQRFGFSSIKLATGAELRPFVGLRADEVERLVSQAAGDDSPEAALGATLTREIGPLAGDTARWRIRLAAEGDLDAAAETALQALAGPAESFYSQYSDLAAIDEHLNSFPDQPAAFSISSLHRAQAGIVVARLVRRADLAGLIDGFHRLLRHVHEPDVAEFDRFAARLEAILDRTY